MGPIPAMWVRRRDGSPQCGDPRRGQILTIYTTADGTHVALRPVCETLGLDADSQLQRIKRQPWATTVIMTGVAADGKTYEMMLIDRRTFTMWLATIGPGLAGPRGIRVV